MTWGLRIERTAAKSLVTYIRTKSERLSINIELIIYKASITSIIVYACLSREYATDDHFLKLQRLQNRVLRAIGNFYRHIPAREMHMALEIPYVYDYITKL
jgi:hypothetical protein